MGNKNLSEEVSESIILEDHFAIKKKGSLVF